MPKYSKSGMEAAIVALKKRWPNTPEQQITSLVPYIIEAYETGKEDEDARHTCHWPGCDRSVMPKLWGCKEHWFKLPVAIRNALWKEYRPGQEVTKDPSPEYVAAAKKAQEWIAAQEKKPWPINQKIPRLFLSPLTI